MKTPMPLQIVEPQASSQQHLSPQGVVIGIDLGTTHSVVAVMREGKAQALTFGEEGPLIPSILSHTEKGFKVGKSTGEALSSTKRLMGRAPHDPICMQFPQWVKGEEAVRLQLGEHKLTPVEVAGHILSHLRNQCESMFSLPLEGAVITVPAYFDEAARVATKQAAALAGIKVWRLLNEPTAAALAYGLETGAEGIYAVYDFGGGTFDLSLLKLEKGVFQVLATGGDLNLGGDDIDHALVLQGKTSDLAKARALKESLSTQNLAEGMSREELEALALPFVKKTLIITQNTLDEASLPLQDIKGVILVGGMTRMPLVKREVAAFFGHAPLCEIDPDQAVALGAARMAHGLKHGSDVLLLDVAPLSLGLETMGGVVEKIIPRHTPLPALVSQEFTTYQDRQQGLLIHVVQGERELVQDCLSLARFELKGLPPLPAGGVRIRVDFMVDVEGLLTVNAFEKTRGLSHHVEVRPSYGLDEQTLSQMILEAQKHGKEDMQKRMAIEEKVKSDRFAKMFHGEHSSGKS